MSEPKLPKSVQALLSILDSEKAKIAAIAKATVADDASETDVENASALATIAATMLPKAEPRSEREKLIAIATAKANSVALALGDVKAKRAPSTPSHAGYKMLAKGAHREVILEALNGLANAMGGAALADNLERTTCGTGRGGYVKGKTKAPCPAAKAWRALTGAAVLAGILSASDALALGQALVPKAATKAA